ncbi:MAG: site-specific DNA-methyltransferase [Oscillospiraceae bacterium]|nr:site-specific DNA-methyltransferase [Oscillospiraceae bacterium]
MNFLKAMNREQREEHAKKNPAVLERMEREGWSSARYTQRVLNKEAKEAKKNVEYTVKKDDLHIFQGDIMTGLADKIPSCSINACITDMPYNRRSFHLASALGALCKRTLVDNGVLLVMAGTNTIPEVTQRLGEHLRYWWHLVMTNNQGGGGANLQFKRITPQYKSILMYVNGDKYDGFWVSDLLDGGKVDPESTGYHPHGQQRHNFSTLIDLFSVAGDTILDPFAGGGTTAEACVYTPNKHRKIYTYDIEPKYVQITKERVLRRLGWCIHTLDKPTTQATNDYACLDCRACLSNKTTLMLP